MPLQQKWKATQRNARRAPNNPANTMVYCRNQSGATVKDLLGYRPTKERTYQNRLRAKRDGN